MELHQLELYRQNYPLFCESFGLMPKEKTVEEFMKNIFGIKINNIKNDPENLLFYTYFLIWEKESGKEAGLVGFKGKKDCHDVSEIGYGIDPEFRKRGYMSEALKGICETFIHNGLLSGIKAEVLKENSASVKVLENTGFQRKEETEDCFYYFLFEKDLP